MTDDGVGLIDTNIVILRKRIDLRQLPGELAITTVTLAELSGAPHQTSDPVEAARRVAELQQVESQFDPLPFDAPSARAYGQVVAAVVAAGRQPRGRIADLMIASIAMANQLRLFTTNEDDFAGLENLVEVVPVDVSSEP